MKMPGACTLESLFCVNEIDGIHTPTDTSPQASGAV